MSLMARVARLDADLVFWGLGDPVPVDELKAGDRVFGDPELAAVVAELTDVVYIERDCDLAGGKYKLLAPDGDNPVWHFDPLPPQQQKIVESAPTLEQAVYDLITVGAEAPRVKAWMAWMKRTLDEGVAK